ncbi:hypothetical protein AB6813_10740 [bacterium RCC_150]
MTEPLRGRAVTFALRLGLLAALVSIVAGILGMHVMGSGHDSHAPVAVPVSLTESASCSCPEVCSSMSDMGIACVPAAAHNTLAAPLPGKPPYSTGAVSPSGVSITGYSHRPDSPSPGDLCISRT